MGIIKPILDFIEVMSVSKSFIADWSNKNKKCEVCKYRALFRCGCKRYRETIKDKRYLFCGGNYNSFEYSYYRFRDISIKISKGQLIQFK